MKGTLNSRSTPAWFGSPPDGWKVDRLKDVVSRIVGGGTPDSGNPENWSDDGYIWVTPTDFTTFAGETIIRDSARKITAQGLRSSATLLPAGTVIMSSRASIGSAKIAGCEMATNQGFISFVCEGELLNRYLCYAINGVLGPLFAETANGTTFNEISRGTAKRYDVSFPPLHVQKRIAAYLDASCAAIDRAVATKQQQLETLDALRKSIIRKAVTQGLNPEVEMKESGAVHLGPVPKHWRVRRVKDVFEFHNNRRIPLSSEDRGVMVNRDFDYYGASGAIDKVEGFIFEGRYILLAEDGANLLSRSKPLAFFAEGQFWVNNHAHVLKPWRGDEFYWCQLLESFDFSLAVTGSAQPKLNMQNLGRLMVPVPPLNEQEQISEYIAAKTREMARLQEILNTQISTLIAYRNSLIHECVTGQRRITDTDVAALSAGIDSDREI